MLIKHSKNILTPQDGASKICALAWSPNNTKLAVCTSDRVVLLYDEIGEKKDKFSLKPADAKYGKASYTVKAIAFSPDSTKIAVGQTDKIIYVYKIGLEWGDKKVICNKFILQSSVTCMVWPSNQPLIFGQADGKVRAANMKSNKSSTIYAADSFVLTLSASPSGKAFVSGHADHSIIRYTFEDDGSGEIRGKMCQHCCPPYALAYTSHGLIAAGCDKRIIAYGRDGRSFQHFDYSREEDENEFTTAICSPSGLSVVLGSFDRLKILNWSPRKGVWEEPVDKKIANLYTITALGWKPDGSRISAGTLCGGVEIFTCSLKKINYKNKFEIIHVGLSQVIVRNLSNGNKIVLKSQYGYEIDDVRIMGSDRYLVANSSDTLMLGDLHTDKFCEIPWQLSGGNEKFYFDNENVCMIFNAGELTLIEYGVNEIIGCVRTEFMNPHLVSARLNERKVKGQENNKKIAYLLDMKTIAVVDLLYDSMIAQVEHDSKIDWMELNETGRYLLFRDKRMKLNLFNIEEQQRVAILNYCSYVQWVPGSDIVVAQNRGNLCVWYNIEAPQKVTMFSIKGDIVDLVRKDGKTEVVVNESVSTVTYCLDEGLIEFGTAIDDGDYVRAVTFLETLDMTSETEVMWKTLSKLALDARQLHIAQRCYAAIGDVSKAQFLHDTIEIAEKSEETMGRNGLDHYRVRARLAIMDKRLKEAESIFLEQNQVDEAIEMYQEMYMWDEAIQVAEAKCHPDVDNLRRHYYNWLLETGQDEAAGQVKEKEGDNMAAINLYLKASLPTKAARVAINHDNLMSNHDLIGRIATALIKAELHERAGDLYERIKEYQRALQSYRKGKSYQPAVELARHMYPSEVVKLEEEWGEYLVSQKQLDAAINHFIEAGATTKAVEAAINSRQWKKAVQILELQDSAMAARYYKKIADHYASIGEYKIAERLYVEANCMREAVDMYNNAGMWQEAHKLASTFMNSEDVSALYVTQADKLKDQGRYKEAERLFVAVEKPDRAITMYKKLKMYPDIIRLVKQYHGDMLEETYCRLAKELEMEGDLRQAELYLLEANNAKAAINMYRVQNMWEDAYRVAKSHGSNMMSKQVAFLWARSLGGDSAVKLLSKFGLLEEAIDYAAEQCAFDFAFDLAHIGMKNKLPDIYYKQAMYLEDEGKLAEAEAGFIKATRPKEAVLMYMHNKDWESALRIAEAHDPDLVAEVLVGQARIAFQEEDFARAESLLLRAQQPEQAIKYYKDREMWQDALRLCNQYLPNKLQALQDEHERAMISKSSRGIETLLRQAREWENSKDYAHAVDCYLKVTQTVTSDTSVLLKCWHKAVDLAVKFLGQNKSVSVVEIIIPRLEKMEKFNAAGHFYLKVELFKEAIDMFIKDEDWTSARNLAREHEPRYESYVEEQYKESMKSQGKADALANVDIIGALDMYVEKGQWEKCLEIAEKQNEKVLHKYVAIYAAYLITEKKPIKALELYSNYRAPPNPQNFNIYKRIMSDLLNMKGLNVPAAYKVWASLRNMFYTLTVELDKSTEISDSVKREFETLLLISHYYATRAAAQANPSLAPIAAKLSVALLRHTDIVPADKAFHEAAMMCKSVGWESMAFVFANHYLDLSEAIEDGTLDSVDHSDFQETDVPFEIPLPERQYLNSNEIEAQKEWVLEVSMNQTIEQVLPKDERGVYEASLFDVNSGQAALPCAITGYPVIQNKMVFKQPGISANKEDWNKFYMAAKVSHSAELQDVLMFISHWCQLSQDLSYSLSMS